MKKITKIGVLAIGAAMATMGAQAVQTPFELGFTASGASDYIIDLGALSLTSTSVVDLSSDVSLSTFNSTFNNSPTGVSMAVVSGNPTFGQYDIYGTQVRGGGAGANNALKGSEATPAAVSQSSVSAAAANLTGNLAWPTTAGTGVVDTGKSYSTKVQGNTGSFFSNSGIQPAVALTSGIVYEDLFFAKSTPSGLVTPSYEGYFTFNYNSDSLTFTSVDVPNAAVPEPATYGAIAGLGLLIVSLRRQLVRKTA
jgi:hypothetical protein